MEGKLVRLRGFEKSDLQPIMRHINDEELKRIMSIFGPEYRALQSAPLKRA